MNLTAPSLLNANGKILAQGSIMGSISGNIDNTNGTMSAQQDLTIGNASTNTLTNTQGTMTAGGNLTVQAATLNNTGGTLIAAQDISVITNSNNLGTVTAGRDLNITLNNDFILAADGNMKANRDFNLTATNVTNSGAMAAVGNLKIVANNVINNSNANLQGGTGLTIDATGAVANNGTMEGNTVNINGQTIVNTGSIFGDNLTMTADTISNTGSTATIAATQNVNLFAKTSVENKDDSNIYSMGNINIAGSKEYIDKTGSVLNQSATIAADGNIGINAGMLTNKMREYEIKQTVISEKRYDQVGVFQANDYYSSLTGDRDLYLVQGFAGPDFPNSWTGGTNKNYFTVIRVGGGSDKLNTFAPAIGLLAETVTETTVIPKSSIGKIMAGSNIKLRVDTTNNDMSWILTNGTLEEFGTINNTAVGNTRSTTQQLLDLNTYYWMRPLIHSPHDPTTVRVEHAEYQRYFDMLKPDDPVFLGMSEYTKMGGISWAPVLFGYVGKSYYQTTEEQISGGASSLFGGGKQVIIQGGNVNNTTVAASSISVRTPSNVTSSGQNQGATSAQTTGSTSGQTTNLQVNSGYNSVNSSSIPIGDMQTLLPKSQNQNVASVTSNTSSLNTGIPIVGIQTTLSSGQQGPSTVRQILSNNMILPTSGMFKIHKEFNSPYLVETNSRFSQYTDFISSDYMLQKLGNDPAKIMKRLGDGFYEEQLVRDQVTNLTGRYYLNGYSTAEEQYKALMNNGATYAKQLNLAVGVALTSEQMAQLTSDMVWMVEKEVDGQKVLAPEVYLSHLGNSNLKDDGAVITADNIKINVSGDVNNAGVIKATQGVQIQGVNIANYGGTIEGGKNTQLNAGQNIVNFGGAITGAQVQLVAGNDVKNQTITFTSTLPFMSQATAGNVASINAGENLTIKAGNDVSIIAGQITTGKDLSMNAGHNFTVDSVQQQDRLVIGDNIKDNVSNLVSNIIAGNNLTLSSSGDATLRGAQVSTAGNLNLQAGGNINLSAVKDEKLADKTIGTGSGWQRTRTDDETVVGTTLQGGGQITVSAVQLPRETSVITSQTDRGNITIEGSVISSKTGGVTIVSDKDTTIKGATEKHESLIVTHTSSSGFFSSKTTDTKDYSLVNSVKGSTISGDKVTMASNKDLTLQGSNIVGTNDVTLNTIGNINITSAKETGKDEHFREEKTSGIFSGGGLGFTIGSKSEKTTNNEQTLAEIGSTIGSINSNVSITAGDKVNSAGTIFVAGKDLTIKGKDVTIDNTINTVDSQYKYEFKQTGLSVSLGGGIVNAATDVLGSVTRAGEVQDERLKALYAYKAIDDAKKLGDYKGNLDKGLGINISLGSTKMTSEQTSHTEIVNTSNINAGDNVKITATAGDVNLTATNINATDIILDAKKNININSGENKQQTTSNTSSSSWSVGGTVGIGFNASASKGSGNENEKITTNAGSVINATGTLTIKSGDDTNITGSKVKGDKVVANIGGNLNIASVQDTDNYTAKNQNVGISVTGGHTGGTTGSIGTGKTNSNYASVTDQAGIFAGKDGFDITVGKNTGLKGAVIASESEAVKNALKTGTITFANMENKASYNSSSIGVNYAAGGGVETKNKGLTPNIGIPASGNADSTTKSAIAPGTITITGNQMQDLSGLNRDTGNSLNTLGKIFDKAKVQEQQELAKVFGELAYKQVHIMSSNAKDAAQIEYNDAEKKGASKAELARLQGKIDAWSEGGSNKIALHAFVGGVMANFGGSDVLSGTVGAGVNEAIQGELSKRFKGNPDMHQWASALVGATASKVVGGNVQTGASTAASGTKNNALFDYQIPQLKKGIADAINKGADVDVIVGLLKQAKSDSISQAEEQGLLGGLEFSGAVGEDFKQSLWDNFAFSWNANNTTANIGDTWDKLIDHISQPQAISYARTVNGVTQETVDKYEFESDWTVAGGFILGGIGSKTTVRPGTASNPFELPQLVVTGKGSRKAELNVPGTKYYNPDYKANMSAGDLIWGAKDSGKGLSTMGSATRADAWEAGKAWVGPEAKEIIQSGELIGYSSKDGMRSFRLQYKPNEGMYRANFQENTVGEVNRFGKYSGTTKTEIKNVHVDVID